MNKRLQVYLRSLGLSQDATDEASWEFFHGLRGLNASIANALNYDESDQQARTNCDLMIRSLGYDPVTLRQVTVDDSTTEPTEPDATENAVDLDQVRSQAVAAHVARTSAIEDLGSVSGASDEFIRGLVGDSTITVDVARERIVTEHRSRTRGEVTPDIPTGAPAVHVRNNTIDANVLTAALLSRTMNDPTQSWPVESPETGEFNLVNRSSDDVVSSAVERGYSLRNYSTAEIMQQCLQADGIRCERAAPMAIDNAMRRSAVSASTMVGVFTASVNAALISSYQDAPDTTSGWVTERPVNNYLQNERTRMELNGEGLVKRPRGAEAESTQFSDAMETYRVWEYSRSFTIDRQDLINESFGILEGNTTTQLGQLAIQMRQDLIYSVLFANDNMRDSTALFHADHKNLNTSNALDIKPLESARAAIVKQQENGRNLNLRPTHLIVPASLEATADQLVTSPLIVTGGTAQGNLNTNSKAGISVVADARLDNGVTNPDTGTLHAGSTTTWYLLSTMAPTIEVGYIRGLGRLPQVRAKVLDVPGFGMAFDVSYSVGAKALDWRGLQKNTA